MILLSKTVAILPAHHLTQPLEIGVFEESKKVLASKIAPLIHTQGLELRKIEWLPFVHAHDGDVFISMNIQNQAYLVSHPRVDPNYTSPLPRTPSPLPTHTLFNGGPYVINNWK